MTGQEIVTLAETLTGRTTEGTKMLARVNLIYRSIYREHEFSFALNTTARVVQPIQKNLSVGFTNGAGTVSGGGGFLSNSYVPGGWLNVPAQKKRFYIYTGGALIIIRPNSTFTSTETCSWFKTDWSLTAGGAGTDTAGQDFGRLHSVWQDDTGDHLEIITEAEYERRYGNVSVESTGAPSVCAQTMVDRLSGATMVKETGIRIWPIPDKVYYLHAKFYRVPTDLMLSTTPVLGDARFHDLLAWGAAYLTRLDDADTTWQIFKAEFDLKMKDLVWAYGISPNADEVAPGPRTEGWI